MIFYDKLVILECESRHSFSTIILVTQISSEPRLKGTATQIIHQVTLHNESSTSCSHLGDLVQDTITNCRLVVVRQTWLVWYR